MTGKTDVEILREMRAFYEDEDNWYRGDLGETRADGTYRACMMGSLYIALWGTPQPRLMNVREGEVIVGQRITDNLNRVLREQYQMENIPAFNDDPATTIADVRAILEKAIAELEG